MGGRFNFNPHTDWEDMFNRAYARHGGHGRSYSSGHFRPIHRTDDYGLPTEWGSLSHIPRSKRGDVEAKLKKLQKMKHLGATEGEKAAGSAAFDRLKKMHNLRAILDDIIQFGDITISTAKRVIRDLEVKGGWKNRKLFRPNEGIPNYVWPGMTAAERLEAQKAGMGVKLPLERSIVVPRHFPPGAPIDPLQARLHETGHSADPNIHKWVEWHRKAKPALMKAVESGKTEEAEKRGIGIIRSVLQNERRANVGVLTSIQAHGTPTEVSAWKNVANRQMKQGYRRPIFNAAMATSEKPPTLTERKKLLRDVPELRGRVLNLESQCGNSMNPVIQFGILEKIMEKIQKKKENARRHRSHGGGT